MHIQYFVFNYSLFVEAEAIHAGLMKAGCDAYLINCACKNDPPFEETDRIKKFPNIYYSGQWNEALKILTGDVGFFINSDVRIQSIPELAKKAQNFYDKYGDKAGIYAPNMWWTPWTYDPSLLEDIGDNIKKVPATDSTIWSVVTPIARKVGPMDLKVNKLGWGIEVVSAYYCSLEDRLVVRDYSIKCQHPQNTAYDRTAADNQWRKWIADSELGRDFWKYYESRNKYGFGWIGKDEPPPKKFKKLML